MYFDYLRIIATFAVIVLHVAARNIGFFEINTMEWKIFVFYDSLVRFSVPIFIMISGALLLGREYNIKEIYTKRIFRLITAFAFWSLLYSLVNPNIVGTKEILLETIKGHSHMWFVPMIVGLYISIPVLSLISSNRDILKYSMLVLFVFSFILPTFNLLIHDFGTVNLIQITDALNKTISLTNIGKISGYFGYFLLGYFLNTEEFNKKIKNILYLLGFFGLFATQFFTVKVSILQNNLSTNYYANISLNVFLVSVMVFIFAKSYLNEYDGKYLRDISQYTFGAFLIHALMISKLYEYFDFSSLHPVVEVPVVSILVFISSLIISYILNKTPILKKYIV